MSSRAEALPILDISQPESEWTFDKRAFNSVLSKCGDRPIAIYSINGATRSGKSFLLNYFIRHFECVHSRDSNNHGTLAELMDFNLFEWRSGVERVTVGINLWSKPYFVQTDEGREVAVLLLDTQGLFDQRTTYRQNAIIFTVSCLFSSVMMFNQKGFMTEDVLQNVERFSNFTNNIVYQRNNLVPPSSDFNIGAASTLLFLMRDFELPDYEYGHHSLLQKPAGSNRNFFKDMLSGEAKANDGLTVAESGFGSGSESPEENRQVRRRLQELYPQLATHLLPHPGNKFVRQRIANTNPDPEFQAEAQSFVERTVSRDHLVTKKIRGQVVTGKRFKYCIARIEAILKEADTYFSDLKSMREYDDETQYLRVTNAASDLYESELNHFITKHPKGASEKEFVDAHEIAFAGALDMFARDSLHFSSQQGQGERYQGQLEERISGWFLQLGNINNRNRKKARRDQLIRRAAIGVGGTLAVAGVVGGIAAAIVLAGPVGVGVAGALIATKMSVAAAAGTAGSAAVAGAGAGAGAAGTGVAVATGVAGGAAVVGATVAGVSISTESKPATKSAKKSLL